MPMIFLSEEKKNPLLMEPYATINQKMDDLGGELGGKQIKFGMNRHNDGFCNGFEIDRYYCHNIQLRFSFSRNKQAAEKEEEFLIHHVFEYDFDNDFNETQSLAAASVRKRLDYLYFPESSYVEYSYTVNSNHVQLIFDVLTEEDKAKKAVNMLISQDILIFSRGW